MRCSRLPAALIASSLLLPSVALASPVGDLSAAMTAFDATRSWHATESFSNGQTVTVDHVAPDRWRIRPTANTTEVLIGSNVYMNGRLIPFVGGAIRSRLSSFQMTITPEIRSSLRDAGWHVVGGYRTHAYSFTSQGVPETLYIGPGHLPIQAVTTSRGVTTTITYSQYNAPITITP
jgi:hypothetical protein